MRTVDTHDGLDIQTNNGTTLARLEFTGLADAGERDRLRQILNDVESLKCGNLRRVLKPLFLEMVMQEIKSLRVERNGTICNLSIELDTEARQ